MSAIIGIDYGTKKIGFAIGQKITKTACPIQIVMQNGEMWKKIHNIFSQWKPEIVVIGQPFLADGKTHPLEKEIEGFIITLKKSYNAEIYRENEMLTSVEAREFFSPKDCMLHLDAHAAAIILESWMQNNTNSQGS